MAKLSKYDQVILKVFQDNHKDGESRVSFSRDELALACEVLGFPRIKNLGDIPYSYRFRRELPDQITATSPDGDEWIIIGTGIGEYEFRLASPAKITPAENRAPIKILDATPEIVRYYAGGTDEQALLTRIRYNRLVDVFTGLTCYSIQNHLRTTVDNVGQIEVDEIYFGMNQKGTHFVLPCQAKSQGDRFGLVQVLQDQQLCAERYPNAICRPIAVQFLSENGMAVLELSVLDEQDKLRLVVVDERHYRLVSRGDLSDAEIQALKIGGEV